MKYLISLWDLNIFNKVIQFSQNFISYVISIGLFLKKPSEVLIITKIDLNELQEKEIEVNLI